MLVNWFAFLHFRHVFPWLEMNPLHGSFCIYHMYLTVATTLVSLEDLLWIPDLYWHCVWLHRLPPLTSCEIVTFHMFRQCLWPCQGSVLFLHQLTFLGSYEALFQKQFCHGSSNRVAWRNNLSPEASGALQTVQPFLILLVHVLFCETCSVKILDCISVQHDSQISQITSWATFYCPQ